MSTWKELALSSSLRARLDEPDWQPNVQKGTRRMVTHSAENEIEEFRAASKRSKTTTYVPALAGGDEPNGQTYANMMFKTVMKRLDGAQLRTNRMVKQAFQFALPTDESGDVDIKIFDALLHHPMTVSNEDLGKIMELELSHANSPMTALGTHFYVRSFTLTAQELRHIIKEMKHSENTYEELEQWQKVLDLHAPAPIDKSADLESQSSIDQDDPSTLHDTLKTAIADGTASLKAVRVGGKAGGDVFFTIRYVGRTHGPKRPYDRLLEDFDMRTSGIYHEFVQVLDRLYPAVMDAAETHMIKGASLSLTKDLSESNEDDVERFLIELFDHATLLNRQRGGYFTSYIPSTKDVDAYRATKVKFYHRLIDNSSMTPPDMKTDIDEHFRQVQSFANENPDETGTDRNFYSDDLCESTIREALPQQYRKTATVLIIVGKDITYRDYKRGKTFFEGRSQASNLARDFLTGHIKLENAMHRRNLPSYSNFDSTVFPFANLWPWLKHKGKGTAAEYLAEYFRIAQPIVAATWSREVNELTMANFVHEGGIRADSFLNEIGEPKLRYYEVLEDGTVMEDTGFINIPHYHHGNDKYTSNNQALRRVMDLTWQMTEIICSVAMDVLDEYLNNNEELPPRGQLCTGIIKRFHRLQADPKYTAVFQNFQEAKNQLRQQMISLRSCYPSEDVRPLLNQEGVLKMHSLGVAEGEPGSPERYTQLLQLWDKHIPDLHYAVEHDDNAANLDEWINQFYGLAPGQFLFMQVVSNLPPDEYVKRLLSTFRPEWAKDDNWMQESDERREAVNKCGLWFQKAKKSATGDAKWVHSHFPDQYVSAYDMQGRNVGVLESNGGLILRWMKSSSEKVNVRLHVKPAIPRIRPRFGLNTHARAVDFTEHGIDVVDAWGNAFRSYLRKGEPFQASVLRESLASTESGPVALELWKAVREAHGHEVPEDAEMDDTKDWLGGKGIKALARNAKSEKPVQNRPPLANDALYPLDEFLKFRFPNGGTFRTAPVDRVLDSTEDMQAFDDFLKAPEWRKHPYADFWHGMLAGKPDVAWLEKNLMVLRSLKQVRHRPRNLVTKEYVRETFFELGPPGSAPTNPFETLAADAEEEEDAEDLAESQASQQPRGDGRPKRRGVQQTRQDIVKGGKKTASPAQHAPSASTASVGSRPGPAERGSSGQGSKGTGVKRAKTYGGQHVRKRQDLTDDEEGEEDEEEAEELKQQSPKKKSKYGDGDRDKKIGGGEQTI